MPRPKRVPKERLTKEQHEVLTALETILCVIGGRQAGKTWVLMIKIILHACQNPGSNILYCTNSESQAKDMFRRILTHPLAQGRVTRSIGSSPMEIWFGESHLMLASTHYQAKLKGPSYSLCICDEVQDAWDQDGWEDTVPALVIAKQGQIVLSGQPRTTRTWYFRRYIAGIPKGYVDPYSGEVGLGLPGHRTVVLPTPAGLPYQGPEGKAALEFLKAGIEPLRWEREYLCKWCDITEDRAFDPEDVKQCVHDGPRKEPVKGGLYVIGHDLGQTKDRGVSKVMDVRTKEVVDTFRAPKGMKHRRPQADTDQVREVFKLARKWNNATVYVDATGGGAPGTMNDYAREYLASIPNCHPLYFLSTTKENMVDRLKFALERRLISIPSWDRPLIDELLAYECEVRKDTRIFHGGDGMHDDEVCSLILANEGVAKQRNLLGAEHFNLGKHITGA